MRAPSAAIFVLLVIKHIKTLLVGIIVGGLIVFAIYKQDNREEKQEDLSVVIERVEAVQKLVVAEGYFSELYSYKEADKYFYSLIEFEKKALLSVKGKASIVYDLKQMDYLVDKEAKTITLVNIPAPELQIQPEIRYFDLEQSTFNSFDKNEYNQLNERAISKLKTKVNKSSLKTIARNELERTLNDLQIVGKELGWQVIVPKT